MESTEIERKIDNLHALADGSYSTQDRILSQIMLGLWEIALLLSVQKKETGEHQ